MHSSRPQNPEDILNSVHPDHVGIVWALCGYVCMCACGCRASPEAECSHEIALCDAARLLLRLGKHTVGRKGGPDRLRQVAVHSSLPQNPKEIPNSVHPDHVGIVWVCVHLCMCACVIVCMCGYVGMCACVHVCM